VCLECGKELSRGRDSYKKRHWEQSHKEDKTNRYKNMIVPKNHDMARALLKERASSKNLPSTSSFRQDDIEFLDGDDHDDGHNDDPLLEENVATANTQSPMDMEQDCDVLMGIAHQMKHQFWLLSHQSQLEV
jgi:hypothetical protein